MKQAIAIAAVALIAAAAPAKNQPPAANASAQIGQWKMVTDQVSANLASGQFNAPDRVTLTRADGSVIVADRAMGNYKHRQAELFGHVSVHDASGTFGLKSAQAAKSRGPATLKADQLHLDDTARTYDASGNVHYEQGDTTVDAQKAHLDDTTHRIDLSGKVHVVQGDRTLDAQRAVYNTQTGEGAAENNVTMVFPGITPSIATPKPITIKGPAIP